VIDIENSCTELTMGRGKERKREKNERHPPAEAENEVSASMGSLSLSSDRASFPIPLAMWVCPHIPGALLKVRILTTVILNGAAGRSSPEQVWLGRCE